MLFFVFKVGFLWFYVFLIVFLDADCLRKPNQVTSGSLGGQCTALKNERLLVNKGPGSKVRDLADKTAPFVFVLFAGTLFPKLLQLIEF